MCFTDRVLSSYFFQQMTGYAVNVHAGLLWWHKNIISVGHWTDMYCMIECSKTLSAPFHEHCLEYPLNDY